MSGGILSNTDQLIQNQLQDETERSSVPRLRAKLTPEQLTAVVDTREQSPLDLSPLQVTSGTLATGDYSIRGLESVVAIERKSLPDLIACVGRERERFDREVQRLLACPVRALVVESTWGEIEMGQYRGKVPPNAVIGSLMGWIAQGLPVVLIDNHAAAGSYVSRLLFIAANRRWREARSLIQAVTGEKRRHNRDAKQ